MKRYINGKDLYITEYASMGEFLQDINSLPNNKFYKGKTLQSQSSDSYDAKWTGTKTYEEAVEMATKGYTFATEKMAKKVKMTSSAHDTVRSSKPAYGVVGSQASVPRYLQGIPTNMVSRQMTYAKQKVVTITKGISYNSGYTTEQIIDESVKALQIVQAMENAGQRVRLNIMFSVSRGNYHCACKVCIKQPDERLSISKMSFAMAHPSMLRRLILKWVEVDPFATADLGYGYGTPDTPAYKEKAMSENEYYIPEVIKDLDGLVKQIQSGVTKTFCG